MRLNVLGGGPGGLYFAALWKRRHPRDQVRLVEQSPADTTWGFGVVFSDRALEFLRGDDPATADLVAAHMQTWRDITIVHRGEAVAIDGVGFSAIGRLQLLALLQQRAREAGVELEHGRTVAALGDLGGCDLIVAADGVNSLARRTLARELGATTGNLDAKFAWYGTPKPFDTLTQTFVECELGTFNAHHYRYAPGMSTFIVECDPLTWMRAGLDSATEEDSRRTCERVFAATLHGHPLISNRSVWRNFPWVWAKRWWHGNVVLIGDALHTAHYSIGSGTRLAMEDALALVNALEADPGDIPAALSRYETERKPIVEKLVAASRRSAQWYERFPEHMRLAPLDLAMSYIQRSGRVDAQRLRAMAPRFMALYERSAPRSDPAGPTA
jgi:2-polyprenyl-6-methoxyphenol hydroxylase-like FAD-dependent oxidoreductase